MNFDENNIVTGKLRYQGILDVSFYTIYQNDNMKYKAKINSSPGLPKAVYIIINIISIIQLIGPCFYVDSTFLWAKDSVFTTFMKSIGCIWQLWSGKSRLYAGIVFSVLIFIFEIISGFWAGIISKKQVIRKGEYFLSLLSGKYLRPILTILAFSSLPESINRINTDKISIVCIILFVLVALMGPFDLYLMSARILVENNPNHEWNQFYPFLSFLVTAALVILSSSVSFVGKTFQVVFMILCAIIYALYALYIFIVAPTIKRNFSLITCSLSLSGCFVSIFSIIFLYTNGVNSALLIILFILFFVIFYIASIFLNKRITSKIMMIFSQCECNPDESDDILKKHFKSANQFIHAVHISFQNWSPFLLSWKPFTTFCHEYPENSDLILLWIRICALFPQEVQLFKYLIGQYANLKNSSYIKTSLLTQMVIIQSSRSVESTPTIMKSITSISKRIEVAHSLQLNFWERILQKSTDVFWQNVHSISKLLNHIDNDILQLINSYPNNIDILNLYCSFLKNVKCDFIKYQEWSEKLQQLRNGIPLQHDIAIQSAQFFLPEMQQFCAESQFKKQEESQSEVLDFKAAEIDFQHLQVKVSLQELVSKSRIGSITSGIVILMIGTILTILAYIWYSSKFKGRFIDDAIQKSTFMRAINSGLFNFGYLANFVALHPLIISGALKLCDRSKINDSECTKLMTTISPILYPLGRIVPWVYETSHPQFIISVLREKLVQIQFSLGNLTHSNGCNEIYNDLFINPYMGDLTPIQALLKCAVDATSILKSSNFNEYITNDLIKSYDHEVDLVTDELLKYTSRMVKITIEEREGTLNDLNTYFLLTLFAVLILIALPFNMAYYLLRIESGLVTLAFTSLPNTAVREIIHNLSDKNNSKSGPGTNSHNVFLATAENNTNDTIHMYLIFFLSMIMVIACCLYLYYLSFDYSETLIETLQKVASFQETGYYIIFVLYRILRAASFNLLPPIVGLSKEELANITEYGQHYQLLVAQKGIVGLRNSIDSGLWGPHGTMNSYYQTKVDLDYFTDVIPAFTDLSRTSGKLTIFEELANVNVVQQFDILVKDLYLFVSHALNIPDLDYKSNKYFLPLIYYGNVFAGSDRFPTFFNAVSDTIASDLRSLNSNIKGLIVGVAIIQVIVFILMTFYLYSKSFLIKKALLMFLFFNPQVILQNQNVMLLLTKRSIKNFEDESSYLDAEKVIENTDEAALIMDKKLIISDCNNAFLDYITESKENIINKQITDVLKSPPNSNSVQIILIKLNDVFKGNKPPTFKERITILTPSGKEKDVIINVICLTSNGTATESNFNEICGMAFLFDDQTEQMQIEAKILAEKKKITEMLCKVIPENAIEELQKGSDSIALSVQSASIGCIEVCPTKSFDPNDFNAPFKLLSTVFNSLDEMIKEFPKLTKIRTKSFTYEYAGGLFGSVNKPDKHAEEATRFALKVISNAKQIGEKVGSEIEFKIGLNTGGPLVAGVIGLNKPTFHLIGPTVDLAQRMKSSGVVNQVQVTRAVYELIYAYNFHVTERGDIDTGGGKIFRTYVIIP